MIVQFVVGKDGSISDVHTVRSVSPELDAEAVRVVSMMPKWNPGKQRGKAVSVKYTMPIMFRLQSPAPKAEEAKPAFHQISLKVDKEVDPDDVDMVKDFLKGKYVLSPFTIANVVEKTPIIIVDGKEIGYGANALMKINHEQIKTISILKDSVAVTPYGEKAKDGVIMIVTKNNQQ